MENGHLARGGADFAIGEHNRPPIRSIALDDIRIDEGVQARAQIVAEVVDEYTEAMREGAAFPPLTVFEEGDTRILADGFTRHAAAKRAGRTNFDCTVMAGGLRDAMLFAAGANATHGYPRSNQDKRCAVRKLLADDEWCVWSDREIARHCHVGHQLVAELRLLTGRPTSERKFRSKHGSTGKMKVGKIGKGSNGKSHGTASSPAGEAQQLELFQATAGINETKITPSTLPIAEAASAAAPEIDEPAAHDGGQVNANQHVRADEALGVLAAFANFILPRIAGHEDTVVITVTAEDVDEFNVLADRVRSVINQED